jgi:LmbE family N-acetylglucosaminyl deacetylase
MVFAAIFVTSVSAAGATEPSCTSSAMYVVAHQDDTLLFQSPSVLRDIQSGRCVRTVFLTAGDAGQGQSYWSTREEGAEAAYAQMAGVSNQWTGSQVTANGHSIHLETLVGQPGVSIAYMRLPDGGDSGGGTELYEFQSLEKLWKKGNPGSGGPTISSITAVDGSASYGYQNLIDTLAALMDSFEPRQIATQNYTEEFSGPDHSDHVGTAYFTRAAQELYDAPHRLVGFEDYETSSKPQNVFDELLGAKSFAFYTYGAHDLETCADEAHCASTSYAKWLKRQYLAGTETVGVVAHAGYIQTASADDEVTLDGSQSSDEDEDELEYDWSQTGGPTVALSDADTDSPSFTIPSHPTLLTFSLVVDDGSTASAPDFVMVRVPSSDPTPVAVTGPTQTVDPGAAVSLDGTASWDPNSLPLEYAWLQTGGPQVALSGSASPIASFVASSGPASLTFSLVVSNGTETSAPAVVTISVNPGPPGKTPAPSPDDEQASADPEAQSPAVAPRVRLSRSKVRLLVGRSSRRVVKVLPEPQSLIRCNGTLPMGARCRVTAQQQVVVEGTSDVRRVGVYRLTVEVVGEAGVIQRSLTVQVKRPSGRGFKPDRRGRGQSP